MMVALTYSHMFSMYTKWGGKVLVFDASRLLKSIQWVLPDQKGLSFSHRTRIRDQFTFDLSFTILTLKASFFGKKFLLWLVNCEYVAVCVMTILPIFSTNHSYIFDIIWHLGHAFLTMIFIMYIYVYMHYSKICYRPVLSHLISSWWKWDKNVLVFSNSLLLNKSGFDPLLKLKTSVATDSWGIKPKRSRHIILWIWLFD